MEVFVLVARPNCYVVNVLLYMKYILFKPISLSVDVKHHVYTYLFTLCEIVCCKCVSDMFVILKLFLVSAE